MTGTITTKDLKALVADPQAEGRLYEEMLALRKRFSPGLIEAVRVEDKPQAIARAVEALQAILHVILEGKDVTDGDPGHGLGHWVRDYTHSLYLAHDPEIEPRLALPGILGGTLHDIGTLFIPRYEEKTRALRHAEVGALLAHAAALECGVLDRDEADLIAWTIAGHAHYLKPSMVRCADGVEREVQPYPDMHDGQPILAVWLPRWADRLDCSGPCMVARHYLTLARDHEDYNGQGFYKVSFAEAMRPLLRTKEQIAEAGGAQTMLEHMRMFGHSQTNDSVYGKHDRGRMVRQRDAYRASLLHIIDQVAQPTDVDVDRAVGAWSSFLRGIEPTVKREIIETLENNFCRLEPATQRAWACGFRATMAEYHVWFDRISAFFQTVPHELSTALFTISPDLDDGIVSFLSYARRLRR